MTPAKVITPRGYWRDVPDWERRNMTVCIAAVGREKDYTPAIVFCSDTRMSGPLRPKNLPKK